MKYQTRDVRLAIKNGKLNLWASITDLSEKYNINVEAHSKFNPGVYNAIVAQLPFSDFTYDEFVEMILSVRIKTVRML